jgi:large subunit ribosomal protein L6
VDKQTHLVITGVDRQLVGQTAANIRGLRKPDPYKQKAFVIRRATQKKAGKAGGSGP